MKKAISIITTFLLIIFALTLNAQEESKPKVGISASIQNSQFGISIPFRISNKITIAPVFDLKYGEKIGTDFSVGIAPKFYLKTEKVSPYIGFKVGAIFNMPSSDNLVSKEKTTDLLLGGAFGGEYFFDNHFCIGVELQGNFTKSDKNSDRFGNAGGLNFNTATMVTASIYF